MVDHFDTNNCQSHQEKSGDAVAVAAAAAVDVHAVDVHVDDAHDANDDCQRYYYYY